VTASDDAGQAPAWQLLGIQQTLISAHLIVLTRLIRRSAQADYTGLEPENWIDRRIILTLFRLRESSVSALANSLGNDLAQVSRSLKSLSKRNFLERDQARGPYRLSEEGRGLGSELDQLALLRDQELVQSFTPSEMFELGGMIASLCARAMDILAEEAAISKATADVEQWRSHGIEIYNRIIPAIFSLSNFIARGAGLAIKRLTSLSQYEWRILAFIFSRPSITFLEIMRFTDSDKAQLSRALDTLTQAGLLIRTATGRGKQVSFETSPAARAVHQIMQEDALRRNEALLVDLNGDQPNQLRAYLMRLISTAETMTNSPRYPFNTK